MAKVKEITAIPLKIQGRSYAGTGSIEDIVLCILEKALKCSG